MLQSGKQAFCKQTNKESYNNRGNIEELNPSDILNTILQTCTKKFITELLESFKFFTRSDTLHISHMHFYENYLNKSGGNEKKSGVVFS